VLNEYVYPLRDQVNEIKSIKFYSAKAADRNEKREDLANVEGIKEVISEVTRQYVATTTNVPIKGFLFNPVTGYITNEVWSVIEAHVVPASTPSIPLCKKGTTNGEIFKKYSPELKLLVEGRLSLLMRTKIPVNLAKGPPTIAEMQVLRDQLLPVDIVQKGLQDPVRYMNKADFIKKNKELRGIFAVSLIDSIIDMLVFTDQGLEDMKNWVDGCVSSGIDFYTQANSKAFFKSVREDEKKIGKLMQDDIENWDWSVTPTNYYTSASVLCLQRTGKELDTFDRVLNFDDPCDCYVHLLLMRSVLLMLILVVLTNGIMIIIASTLLPSGARFTNSGGSVMRISLGAVLRALMIKIVKFLKTRANGDDCLEPFLEGLRLWYNKFGFIVTDEVVSTDSDDGYFTYCSQIFTKDGSYPENWKKPLLKLVNQNDWNEGTGEPSEHLIEFNERDESRPGHSDTMVELTSLWERFCQSKVETVDDV